METSFRRWNGEQGPSEEHFRNFGKFGRGGRRGNRDDPASTWIAESSTEEHKEQAKESPYVQHSWNL
jgi:hypothetical protein